MSQLLAMGPNPTANNGNTILEEAPPFNYKLNTANRALQFLGGQKKSHQDATPMALCGSNQKLFIFFFLFLSLSHLLMERFHLRHLIRDQETF